LDGGKSFEIFSGGGGEMWFKMSTFTYKNIFFTKNDKLVSEKGHVHSAWRDGEKEK